MFGKRILILVAHPDDEIVACAASILRAKAAGAEIFALYLTHGCLDRETLWPWQRASHDKRVARRRAEAETAASHLGIKPVGWSSRPARHLWREMAEAMTEIDRVLIDCYPDQIWCPAYEGGNPDHDALNAVASTFRGRLSVLEFAEYNFFGGKARSNKFISGDETVRVTELTPQESRAKRAALKLYQSEQDNLFYVGCDQESYRPLSSYDYAQPPHMGKLWYARFQWVPFRHPGVDVTNPADVSAAITEFLS
jgi:LmbE family N-acetylglucosaminyl deacetylase